MTKAKGSTQDAARAPGQAWRSRIIGHGEEAPDQLLAHPSNWRIHPQEQQEALAGVLAQVGWVQNVVVNQRTGFVVDGHLRVALAISKGEATVPVTYVDLSEEEEALILATFDPLSAMAVADTEQLGALLDEIAESSEEALRVVQFIARENDAMAAALEKVKPGRSKGQRHFCVCPNCGDEHEANE